MTSIFECAFTKTLDTVFEAATTTNGLYVNNKDGSLLCSHWFPAAFTRKISVANIDTVTAKIDEAFTLTERMLEINPEQANVKEINHWVLAALRTQQLFEAAREKPTPNAMINEIATRHTFHFHLPDAIKGCIVGLASVVDGPYSIAEARGPNVIGGRYFYGEPSSLLSDLLKNAHIGLLTQLERFRSMIIKIIQAVTGIFGVSLPSLNRFHYFRNNETNDDIYDVNSIPMALNPADATSLSSYWLGHSTCSFSVPVGDGEGHFSRVNVITDPTKGDLNRFLYPAMIDQSRSIEQCPPAHVCIISHNHPDHFSPETLQKLLPQNPLMVVPKGDGERLRTMGFTRVVELGWFERIDVQVKDPEGHTYLLGISGVPANHSSGNQQQPLRTSLFNGYVIQSESLDGDIYFAGDTARLDADHTRALRDRFSIKYSFQPGGPDEVRRLLADSHQASCDGIAMHLHLMVSKVYMKLVERLGILPSFEQLRAACAHMSTVYMHMKTYKLGNACFDETASSVARVLQWLNSHDSWEEIATADRLKTYEKNVLTEIAQDEGSHIVVGDNHTPITPRQIGELLEGAITVPKIGARFSAR